MPALQHNSGRDDSRASRRSAIADGGLQGEGLKDGTLMIWHYLFLGLCAAGIYAQAKAHEYATSVTQALVESLLFGLMLTGAVWSIHGIFAR